MHGRRHRVDDRTRRRLRTLTPKQFVILSAVADRILDGCRPTARQAGVVLWLDAYLASMDPAMFRELGQLLLLLEHGPILFADGLGRFTDLPAAAQDRCLAGWERSRFVVKRAGFSALKSLVMLGYYRDERTFGALRYHGPLVPRGYDVHAVPR